MPLGPGDDVGSLNGKIVVDGFEDATAHAIVDADEVLRGPYVDAPTEDVVGGQPVETLRDPDDVHSVTSDAIQTQAQLKLDNNAPLERQLLAQLPPSARAKYAQVATLCGQASNAVAALALQKLLFQDRLVGPTDARHEGMTLDHLARLATTAPLAKGVDRKALVTDLVQELATPSSIDQGDRGTCAPTTLAIQLAVLHPAEYARITEALASPHGSVILANGSTMLRLADPQRRSDEGRSEVQRLMAPSFLDLANGPAVPYDDKTDEGAGAFPDTLSLLYSALMGRKMGYARVDTDPGGLDQAVQDINRQLANGMPVSVAVDWPGGGHELLLTTHEQLAQSYSFINPWGVEERISDSALRSALIGIMKDPEQLASAPPTPGELSDAANRALRAAHISRG